MNDFSGAGQPVRPEVKPDNSGQWTVFAILVAINVFWLIVVFSSKTYVEETVMSQIANIVSRANGLLALLVIDLVALVGVLLFRR